MKGKLTTVIANWTRSGQYNTEDSEWITSAEHAQSLTSFNGGIDWVLYAFAFIDRLQMGTYNKVMPGGFEDGSTPGSDQAPGGPPTRRGRGGVEVM